uniref:Uncharacterized protein n=1 Tax=Physcomitrium patens TaxID=3218 RepID=A0A2K1IB61_PHYPA|nr:hypothetical protein PHYPA_031083 [Physcomitrium patens]
MKLFLCLEYSTTFNNSEGLRLKHIVLCLCKMVFAHTHFYIAISHICNMI